MELLVLEEEQGSKQLVLTVTSLAAEAAWRVWLPSAAAAALNHSTKRAQNPYAFFLYML